MPQDQNLYRRGNVWYGRVTVLGVEKRHSLRTTDYEEAQRRLRKFFKDVKGYHRIRERRRPISGLPRLVYFIGGDTGPVKIGVAHDVQRRLSEIRAACPVPMFLLATAPGGFKQEKTYHRAYASQRMHCEWFERTPEMQAEIDRLRAMSGDN